MRLTVFWQLCQKIKNVQYWFHPSNRAIDFIGNIIHDNLVHHAINETHCHQPNSVNLPNIAEDLQNEMDEPCHVFRFTSQIESKSDNLYIITSNRITMTMLCQRIHPPIVVKKIFTRIQTTTCNTTNRWSFQCNHKWTEHKNVKNLYYSPSFHSHSWSCLHLPCSSHTGITQNFSLLSQIFVE